MSAVNWIVGFVCLLYPVRSLSQGMSSSPSTGEQQEQVREGIACGTLQALNNGNAS